MPSDFPIFITKQGPHLPPQPTATQPPSDQTPPPSNPTTPQLLSAQPPSSQPAPSPPTAPQPPARQKRALQQLARYVPAVTKKQRQARALNTTAPTTLHHASTSAPVPADCVHSRQHSALKPNPASPLEQDPDHSHPQPTPPPTVSNHTEPQAVPSPSVGHETEPQSPHDKAGPAIPTLPVPYAANPRFVPWIFHQPTPHPPPPSTAALTPFSRPPAGSPSSQLHPPVHFLPQPTQLESPASKPVSSGSQPASSAAQTKTPSSFEHAIPCLLPCLPPMSNPTIGNLVEGPRPQHGSTSSHARIVAQSVASLAAKSDMPALRRRLSSLGLTTAVARPGMRQLSGEPIKSKA